MSIHIGTPAKPIPIAVDFWSSPSWTFNVAGHTPNGTALREAIKFLDNAELCGSAILSHFAKQGFPHGDPSSPTPCRYISLVTDARDPEIAGGSGAAACLLGCFTTAIGVAARTLSDMPARGGMFPPIVATGVLDRDRIRGVQQLPQKLDALHRWQSETPDTGNVILVIPEADRAAAASHLERLGLGVRVEYVTSIADCFHLSVRLFVEVLDRALRKLERAEHVLATFAWERASASEWRPNNAFASDAVNGLLRPAGYLTGRPKPELHTLLEWGWNKRHVPLDDVRPAGQLFDQALLRFAAFNFVMSTLVDSAKSRTQVSVPTEPPRAPASHIEQYRAGQAASWTEEQWLELVREVLAAPPASAGQIGQRALIPLAESAVHRLSAAEYQKIDRLPERPGSLADEEALQQIGLVWDAESVMRLKPAINPTSPILHVWVTGEGAAIEQVVVVGRGTGFVRRDVEGLLTAIGLQSTDAGAYQLRSGVAVLRAHREEPLLLDPLSASLVAFRGAFFNAASAANMVSSQDLHFVVQEIQKLAVTSGLVEIHRSTSDDLQQLLTALDTAGNPSSEIHVKPLSLQPEVVAAQMLHHDGRPAAIGVPPFLFTSPVFGELVLAYGAVILEQVNALLDWRISFYIEVERNCDGLIAHWNSLSPDARERQPDVTITRQVNLIDMVEKPIVPRSVSAKTHREQILPEIAKDAREYRRRTQLLKDGANAARTTTLPAVTAQRFCDAVLRDLEPEDIVADCPGVIARAYREWRASTRPVLKSLVLDWCDRHGLTRAEDRHRVLTRHVTWSLVGGPDRTSVVPTVVVHSQQSIVVEDGSRRLKWVVHPLDTASCVSLDREDIDRREDEVRGLVHESIEAREVRDSARSEELLTKAMSRDPVPTMREVLAHAARAHPREPDANIEVLKDAVELMNPLVTLFHALDGRPFSGLSALETFLLRKHVGPVESGPAVKLPEDFHEWMRIPEIPLRLAAHYDRWKRGNPALERTRQQLLTLARLWDAEYVERVSKIPEPENWPLSDRAQAIYRREHLSHNQRDAYAAGRTRELYRLAMMMTGLINRLDWPGAAIRQLYLDIGQLADELVEMFPMELGMLEARRLLEHLLVFEKAGQDAV
jgi:hypothetical protein